MTSFAYTYMYIYYWQVLRNTLDKAGLSQTRIVAADGGWGIANDILKDTELATAIDFIGYVCYIHYTLYMELF